MVSVFKMLCSLCDFEAEPVSVEDVAANRPSTDKLDHGTQKLSSSGVEVSQSNLSLQLNITIAESASETQIENVFKYAAKHLLGRDSN